MKKLLGILVLGLLLSGNAFSNVGKNFYISCSAKGYQKLSYSGTSHVETIIDEYKIIIGKGDMVEGDRWPKVIELVNTSANRPGDFYLHRKPVDDTVSYSDRVISISTKFNDNEKEVYHKAHISLISGLYNIFYEDKIYGSQDDVMQYSGIGKCNGLAPVLSYLENNTKSSIGGANSTIKKLLKKLY